MYQCVTSLTAAFTIGIVISAFPSPTRTKHPPDLVAKIPNLALNFGYILTACVLFVLSGQSMH